MGVGLISESVFGDIANAIREQNGTATTYKPSEMAAAVTALDGTNEGNATTAALGTSTGVIGEAMFTEIANAIRGQNGLTTKYKPSEMAQTIRDLVWDTGLKPRALLLSDGTLEFNYLDGRQVKSGSATVKEAWEVSTDGYAGASDRPWHSVRGDVTRVWIDESFATVVKELGLTNFDYFFNSMSAMTEVVGFQYLSGMTTAKQCFVSCTYLESVYATSFDASALASGFQMFYGCQRLVGGTDGTVAGNSSAYSICKLGEGGVLTDPGNDPRQWFWGTVYTDGYLEISASEDVEWSRRVAGRGRACAQAKYQLASGLPWSDSKSRFTKVRVLSDMAAAGFTELNLNYWFYAYTGITSFEGLGNLAPVSQIRHAFSSCTSVTELNLTGLDPSSLTDLFYAFAGCSGLTTIYVDADWTLPSGCTGNQCFYNCKSLVGGNGTAWSSGKTGVAYCVIDKDGQAGYLTAKS